MYFPYSGSHKVIFFFCCCCFWANFFGTTTKNIFLITSIIYHFFVSTEKVSLYINKGKRKFKSKEEINDQRKTTKQSKNYTYNILGSKVIYLPFSFLLFGFQFFQFSSIFFFHFGKFSPTSKQRLVFHLQEYFHHHHPAGLLDCCFVYQNSIVMFWKEIFENFPLFPKDSVVSYFSLNEY